MNNTLTKTITSLILKDKYTIPAYGLQNGGCTCYWNSLLQCLLSCTQISEVIEANGWPVNSLVGQLGLMYKQQNEAAGVILLRIFLHILKEKKINYTFGFGQESTSEGFILLVDLMPTPLRHLFLHRYLRYKVCGNCGHESDKVKLEMVHFELFGPEVNQITTPQQFADYLLEKKDKVPDYKCDKCGQTHPNTTGHEMLTMASEIIVILFNKYTMAGKSTINYIPDEFELPSKNENPFKYRLVGQARHSGSLGGGHYWAVVRRQNNVYCANDSHISSMAEFDKSPLTYMAFYSLSDC